jgi:hypothetical protein
VPKHLARKVGDRLRSYLKSQDQAFLQPDVSEKKEVDLLEPEDVVPEWKRWSPPGRGRPCCRPPTKKATRHNYCRRCATLRPRNCRSQKIEDKETRPPPRYNEGTLIEAMQNAWRFVDDEVLRERLKEAKGIGTPATRAGSSAGLRNRAF